MKVLIFTTQFYKLNGAERLAVELAEGLNSRPGIRADLLSVYSGDLPGVPEAKEVLLQKGIPSIKFLGMKINPSFLDVIKSIRKLRQLIREQDYDIVETSMLGPTTLVCWATLGLRTRHVAGLHTVFQKDRHNTARHKFWRFSVKCNPRIRFYAVSRNVALHWLKFSKTQTKQMNIIYNGIADDFFHAVPERDQIRQELGIPRKGNIAIFVGRLTKDKGIGTILDALGPVLEKYDLYLLYVGDPDPNVKGTMEEIKHMKDQIVLKGWSNQVWFLGRRKDIPRLAASADVLVHPARIEGFGLVLVEAMAAGLPVVASDVGGIPEVLEATGSLMVPPDDPIKLREAIVETLNRTSEETAEFAKMGRRRAEHFKMEKRIDNMIRLFEEILALRMDCFE